MPNPAASANDITPKGAEAYRDAMLKFANEMEDTNRLAQTIAAKTARIIRFVAGLTLFSTLYFIYTVFILGGDMQRLAGSMVEMYQHFGTMAGEVDDMTYSVTEMGKTMRGLPSIASDMQSMSGQLDHMKGNVGSMDNTLQSMDTNMGTITRNMSNMNQQMRGMTHSVDYMRHNIGEMARPMP